ncbi:MAG: ATP-binding cassette domain-containing protein [Spirochaetaceae bacterium]|jgi:ABC-type oligopeptide transport system ATPase subunit|nr:ATP-binding cassette domain-containing protein [Spirochaetaceae bacterium]
MAIDKNSDREVLLSVQNLTVDFKLGRKTFSAVDDVSFDIFKGETFSLVGESGSGKTTVSRAIMRIHQASKGKIFYKDEDISGNMKSSREKNFRQNVQMIFQDPMASLNERAKVDYIISEGLYNYKLFENEADRKDKVEKTLRKVGLLPEFASRFPHEFSGGQRQRIGIARALIMEPEFLVADEPISALDVSIRAQILNLLNKLKREEELTYLFIAHDLSVVKLISDRIAVIFKGKIVELAESDELFSRPLHLYTQCLLSAIPLPDPESEKNKVLKVYDTSIHNYQNEKTLWQEAYPGHWVLASERELDFWRE